LLVTCLPFEAVGYKLEAQNKRATVDVLLARKLTFPVTHLNRRYPQLCCT